MELMVQKTSLNRIRLSITLSMKEYGNTMDNRLLLKSSLSLISLYNFTQKIAIRRAMITMKSFLIRAEDTKRLKCVIGNFADNMTVVQIKWKKIYKHSIVSKSLIRKKWNDVLVDLIKKNSKMKKASALLRKLRKIPYEMRESTINDYYYEQRRKHYIELNKWLMENMPVKMFVIIDVCGIY